MPMLTQDATDMTTDLLLARFRERIERSKNTGRDGHGKDVGYVPRSCLEDYWTEHRILELFRSLDSFRGNAKQIIAHFLQVFSILAYINRPSAIAQFVAKNIDDHNLPCLRFPTTWHHSLTGEFTENQWIFCPLKFTKNRIFKRDLYARQILPVTFEELLGERTQGGDTSKIHKVHLHPGCNDLNQEDERVVFKMYEGDDCRELYEAESDIYESLPQSANESITNFYGSFSFEETQKTVIVLEYAKKGSLLDFFKTVSPPACNRDRQMFWERLIRLLDGLHVLHNLDQPSSFHEWLLAGVHQDIQPANILVFPQSETSDFDVHFKLADFGLSEMRRVGKHNGDMPVKNAGNRMYSAPECYGNERVYRDVKSRIRPKADVWALGAVYSDALIWSIQGEKGREVYRQARRKSISKLQYLSGFQSDAFFHDGKDRLLAVDETHKTVLWDRRRSDELSPAMSHDILEYMLMESMVREDAMQVKLRMQKRFPSPDNAPIDPPTASLRPQTIDYGRSETPAFISGGLQRSPRNHPHLSLQPSSYRQGGNSQRYFFPPSESYSLQRPPPTNGLCESPVEETPVVQAEATNNSTPLHVNNPAIHPNETYGPNHDIVSVDKVYGMLEKKHTRGGSIDRALERVRGKQHEVMDLPGMQEALSKIKASEGRDQVMVIDNYSSMKAYMETVRKTARVISYVTKTTDFDGMDLYLASDTTRGIKCRNSTDIESEIKKAPIVDGMCHMEICLSDIMKKVLKPPKKPTSIYVYTDGVWEPGKDRVDTVIQRAVDELIKDNKPPSALMFQFIQFGRDDTGTRRLRYLDDDCSKTGGYLQTYDIVDTKHCEDDVPKIIMGSISSYNDSQATRASA